ncbi:MAG: hypothetical protein SGI71_11790 [Verrucomicrobiota bacterium]|nr:hypothetical protein [Verrucomicrobiota bacterium]
MFNRFLFCILCSAFLLTHSYAADEWIVLSGGPALRSWEKTKEFPHDRVWDNFIFTAGLRLEQIKTEAAPDDVITWIVYRPGYERRGQEEGVDYLAKIEKKAQQLGARVLWVDHQNAVQNELIDYINKGQDRTKIKIRNFDYFGHSNKACFFLDYSSGLDGVVMDYLHVTDLKLISKDSYMEGAKCQSYGCHSAALFTKKWAQYTGTHMIGTTSKTDYSTRSWPFPSKGGKWE